MIFRGSPTANPAALIVRRGCFSQVLRLATQVRDTEAKMDEA
jgi:hypothetical protein